MRTVSFYSFKGGVGRSLCLINVAYQLCRTKGQTVGLIDLDIEAGGLHQILGLDVPVGRDLLALLSAGHRDVTGLEQFILEYPVGTGSQQRILILPTVADSKFLDRITWDASTKRFISDELLPAFKRFYRLDSLLIDCRSGLSDAAIFPLKVASHEVIVCRLDRQNRFGVNRLVKICRAASKPFTIVISGCPDRERDAHVKSFQEAIAAETRWILPYEYHLYYDEYIVSERDPQHRLSRLYAALAAELCGED